MDEREGSNLDTQGNHVDQSTLEADIIKVRRLLTRSVTDLPQFASLIQIFRNPLAFKIACHKAYKNAQNILITHYLEIEKRIQFIQNEGKARGKNRRDVRRETAKLFYEKRIVELCYESIVWILMKEDKVSFKSLFKGPKYGLLINQNVKSVLEYAEAENKSQTSYVIPLDFCRFAPICDAIKVEYEEKRAAWVMSFVEIKEGVVNKEIGSVVKCDFGEEGFLFAARRGIEGVAQFRRYLKQSRFLADSIKLIDKPAGIYEDPRYPDIGKIIMESNIKEKTFLGQIREAYQYNVNDKYAVFENDGCFIAGFVNCFNKDMELLGEFDIRHYVLHRSNDECPICKNESGEATGTLDQIRLSDWRSGFSSVILFPILLREPLCEDLICDVLFGRRKLKHYFNYGEFMSLAIAKRLQIEYVGIRQYHKDFGHMPTKEIIRIYDKLIKIQLSNGFMYMCDGTLHDITYNWICPSSIIDRLKNMKYPNELR
jgi:hypothetical protein